MLTKEELENIKVGDIVVFEDSEPLGFGKYRTFDVQGKVMYTRARSGEQGDVFEDYVILENWDEVDYKDIKGVIKQ